MQGKSGSIGKYPLEATARIVERTRRIAWPSTVLPPALGEDAGVIDLGSCLLVAHVDPITEAVGEAARLAIVVAANDVAATGARPQWAQVLILLPPGTPAGEAERIAEVIGEEAARLGIEILGGHTEASPGLEKPIVAAFVYGCACRECLTPTRALRSGDKVLLIGWAGLEGMRILASDFQDLLSEKGVPGELLREASYFPGDISIVDVAVEIAWRRLATSMHDATEGGVLGALVEAALASKTTIRVNAEAIPIPPPLKKIAEIIGIDPLRLISSGALIVGAKQENVEAIIKVAEERGRPAAVIGEALEGPPRVELLRGGRIEVYTDSVVDEIAKLWGEGVGQERREG